MRKSTKLFVFALSLALLVAAFAFITASANEGAPSIEATNVAYGDRIQLLVAVDTKGDDAATVTYTLNGNTYPAGLHPTETYEGMPVYYTNGIAPKDIADEVVFTVTAGDGSVSDTYTYSAATYFYERLYKDGFINAEAGTHNEWRKELYLNCLAYAASAQKVLVNMDAETPETLVTDYIFAWTDDADVLIDGVRECGAFLPGTVITPVYTGTETITTWTILDASGAPLTTLEVGESVTLDSSHIRIVLGEAEAPEVDSYTVMDYQNGASNNFVSSIDGDGSPVTGNFASGTTLTMGLATTGDNSYLQVRNTKNSGKTGVTKVLLSNVIQKGSCYTFESKIKLAGGTGGYNFARLKFKTADGTDALDLILKITANSAGATNKPHVAIDGAGNGASLGTMFDLNKKAITTTAWFTLKIEYYLGAGAEDSYMKLWVDDILCYDGLAFWAAVTEIAYAEINHVSSGCVHNSTYDDIYFTRTEKTYSKSVTE